MKRISIHLTVLLMLAASASVAFAEGVTAPGAELELLSRGFSFTEGPAVDSEGNVYFTDQPNDRIMIWTTDERLLTFMEPAGRSNGLFFDADGNLIACADMDNEMWSISPEKEIDVLFSTYDGKLLNAPNDVWVHPVDGSLYFTDPLYKRGYWERDPEMQQDGEFVYRFDRKSGELTRLETDIVKPNGIIGTPDGKRLYVADIGDKKIYRFDIQADGSLANQTFICEQQSDGLTMDENENIYTTSGDGVMVYSPEGELVEQIKVPQSWTANVTFGGEDRKTLFITARTALYSIEMRVKGAY